MLCGSNKKCICEGSSHYYLLGSFTKFCYFVWSRKRLMNLQMFENLYYTISVSPIGLCIRFSLFLEEVLWYLVYCSVGFYSVMFTVIQAHGVTHDIWHLPPVSLCSKRN